MTAVTRVMLVKLVKSVKIINNFGATGDGSIKGNIGKIGKFW